MGAITEACACARCQCEVDHEDPGAVLKEGHYYCSEACASGHARQVGCGHGHCTCYSLPNEEPHQHEVNQFGIPRPE